MRYGLFLLYERKICRLCETPVNLMLGFGEKCVSNHAWKGSETAGKRSARRSTALPLTAKDQRIHDDGFVVRNRERAAEEAAGQVRWLRPEYQAPGTQQKAASAAKVMAAGEGRSEAKETGEGAARDDRDEKRNLRDFRDNGTAGACATLTSAPSPSLESRESLKSLPASLESLNLPADSASSTTALYPWPDELPAQFALVRRLLADSAHSAADSATAIPVISAKLADSSSKKRRAQLHSILETLQVLGHAY